MTNIDRAARFLYDRARQESALDGFPAPEWKDAPGWERTGFLNSTRALADAGLLAPDLPEPETKPAGWASAPPGTNISEWAVDGLTRAATLPDGTILVHDDGLDVAEDADTLESIALAYLAAVRAARQTLEEA